MFETSNIELHFIYESLQMLEARGCTSKMSSHLRPRVTPIIQIGALNKSVTIQIYLTHVEVFMSFCFGSYCFRKGLARVFARRNLRRHKANKLYSLILNGMKRTLVFVRHVFKFIMLTRSYNCLVTANFNAKKRSINRQICDIRTPNTFLLLYRFTEIKLLKSIFLFLYQPLEQNRQLLYQPQSKNIPT